MTSNKDVIEDVEALQFSKPMKTKHGTLKAGRRGGGIKTGADADVRAGKKLAALLRNVQVQSGQGLTSEIAVWLSWCSIGD